MRLQPLNKRGFPVSVKYLRRITGTALLFLLPFGISLPASSAAAKTGSLPVAKILSDPAAISYSGISTALAQRSASKSMRAAASHPAPTGDATTIAFDYQVQKAYRHVRAVTLTRRGYLAYTDAGPANSFSYVWGETPPVGYLRATETQLYLLQGGRVTTFVDRAKAAGMLPLTLVRNASGAWGGTGSCYSKASGLTEMSGWGQQFSLVYGHFSPLQYSGSTTIIHVTYPWGKTAQASETDRISTATKLVLSYQIRITGGLVVSENLHYPATPPVARTATPHC